LQDGRHHIALAILPKLLKKVEAGSTFPATKTIENASRKSSKIRLQLATTFSQAKLPAFLELFVKEEQKIICH